MGLKEQLDQDQKAAMRAKDETRLSTIRMLKAAIMNFEIARSTDPKNKDHGKPVTDAELYGVVEKQIKQRRDSIEMFEKGNRPELAAKEKAEIQVLEAYMPRQMTRDEITAEVQGIVAELGTKEFPKVMREAAARLKGRADGKMVNEVVRQVTGP